MLYRLFLSYSSVDQALAEKVKLFVRSLGADCYLFKDDVQLGEPIRQKLQGQIRSADAVVFLFTRETRQSNWVFIELGMTSEARTRIICFSEEGTVHPLLEMLAEREHVYFERSRFNAALDVLGTLFTSPKSQTTKCESPRILKRFSKQFLGHTLDQTRVIDYFDWHESSEDLHLGTGLLRSATYGEFDHLWADATNMRFAIYEAMIKDFIDVHGGESRRVFVLDKRDFNNAARKQFVLSVLERHERLGLQPRLMLSSEFRKVRALMSVECDTFGLFNEWIAYFYQCRDDAPPLVIRSIDPKIARIAEIGHDYLWARAERYRSWRERTGFRLEPASEVLVERWIVEVESRRGCNRAPENGSQ